MRKDNQILKVPAALEALLTAAAERVAQVESALFLNLPYQSPIGLFKDLVVLFHEQNSSEEPDCFADHEGIITDLKKSFHWELERRATINDLEASKAVALEVLRALSKPEDSTDVVGERGERKAERSGNSTVVSASQYHEGFDL
jgi:hypothetical protein